MGQGAQDARPQGRAQRGRGVSGGATGNRFGWLTEEEDLGAGETRWDANREARQEAPGTTESEPGVYPGPAASAPVVAAGVPGVPGTARRRRKRAKNPNALRNDPQRMMAGARIRRDVRRRVEQALADPEVGEGTNYSLLVEGLLVRWLEEVGYPLEAGSGRAPTA